MTMLQSAQYLSAFLSMLHSLTPFAGESLSLNLDFSIIWPIVNMMVAMLWQIFSIPLGIRFAFGLMDRITSAIEHAFGR